LPGRVSYRENCCSRGGKVEKITAVKGGSLKKKRQKEDKEKKS